MKDTFEFGEVVLGKYVEDDNWIITEFLKYDDKMEYGKYVCLTMTHDGKTVDCFDEIKKAQKPFYEN